MKRREFIKKSGIACLTCIGMPVLLNSCNTLYNIPNASNENKIIIKKSDFGQNINSIVRNERLQAPIYLLKISESEYSAVLMLCTHKGCELNVAGSLLICPCHGSEFSGSGKVQTPPADMDLQKFIVTSDADSIYIKL